MADERDSAPRARPFTPPLPPFRGAASAPRRVGNPLTPPDAKRGALFVGTRPPSKPVADVPPTVVEIAELAPTVAGTATDSTAPSGEDPAAALGETAIAAVESEADSERADVIAASEAMPWLFEDPGASQPVDATPSDAVPIASLGGEQRADVDVAGVLESIAARVRAGHVDVGGIDSTLSEAAVLATVLAALLRPRAR